MSANAEIIAELRRVLNERDEAREQLDLTKRELGRWVDREAKAVRERDEARASCPDCAMWAERSARWHEDMQRAERERDEARAERDAAIARITEVGVMVATNGNLLAKDAYRRGAEAMREACAVKVVEWLDHRWATALWLDKLIRELPIPEDK